MPDAIDGVLARAEAGDLGDPLPVLAYLAGRAVDLDPGELNGARRRALLLVAAGGDPHRELEVDDRAVKALAADLYTDERRVQRAGDRRARAPRARPAGRARGGALPRGRRRPRLAAARARPARGGARRVTPAVEAAKRAGIEFRLHEYTGVEHGDGDYAAAVAASLGRPPQQLFKTLLVTVD